MWKSSSCQHRSHIYYICCRGEDDLSIMTVSGSCFSTELIFEKAFSPPECILLSWTRKVLFLNLIWTCTRLFRCKHDVLHRDRVWHVHSSGLTSAESLQQLHQTSAHICQNRSISSPVFSCCMNGDSALFVYSFSRLVLGPTTSADFQLFHPFRYQNI